MKQPKATNFPNMEAMTDLDFLETLDQILEANYTNPDFSIAQLCQDLQLSRSSLHRKVTVASGQPISLYIRDFRLAKAYVLIQTTEIPIGSIAFDVGFADIAYFTRCFKVKFGCTPSGVRGGN